MKQNKLLLSFVFLVYLFFFLPLCVIVATSFSDSQTLSFPPKGFSLTWYRAIFSSEMFARTFAASLYIALASTIVALLLGMPAAYALSRGHFRGKNAVKNLFLSPITVPGIVMGFSLLNYLVVTLRLPIYLSLLLGHTLLVLPYVVRVLSSNLDRFDFSVEAAAMMLGATRKKAFFLVVLPNISAGMLAAFILAFINSFNNVPLSLFLTGPGVSTLPISMMSYLEYHYNPTVSALSVLLMLLTVLLMLLVERTLGLATLTKK